MKKLSFIIVFICFFLLFNSSISAQNKKFTDNLTLGINLYEHSRYMLRSEFYEGKPTFLGGISLNKAYNSFSLRIALSQCHHTFPASDYYWSGGVTPFTVSSSQVMFRAGIEKYFLSKRKISPYAAMDIHIINESNDITPDGGDKFSHKENLIEYGLSPNIGLRVKLSNRISISAEARARIGIQKGKDFKKFLVNDQQQYGSFYPLDFFRNTVSLVSLNIGL